MPSTHMCNLCTGTFDSAGVAPPCVAGGGTVNALPNPILADPTGCKVSVPVYLRDTFETTNFVPCTGRGKFNCKLNPGTGVLTITVRFRPEFEKKWGGIKSKFSSSEKNAIKEAFAASVPQYWNGKCVLRCTKAGLWSHLRVRPVFRLEFGSSNAHFRMVISKESAAVASLSAAARDAARECRGFVSINQVTSNSPWKTMDRIEMRDFHVGDFSTTAYGMSRVGADREFFEQAITASSLSTRTENRKVIGQITFPNNSADLTTLLPDLTSLATEVNRQSPGSLPVPFEVKGLALTTETNHQTLATQRATAIQNHLTPLLTNNPVSVAATTGTTRSGADLYPDPAFETAYATGASQYTYNVAAHEFGHLLGLPDEYENPVAAEGQTAGEAAKAIVKTNYLALVARTNSRPPTFPSHTPSMMSDGMSMRQWHYVTVWEALSFLTSKYLAEDEWAIDMVAH